MQCEQDNLPNIHSLSDFPELIPSQGLHDILSHHPETQNKVSYGNGITIILLLFTLLHSIHDFCSEFKIEIFDV